MITENRRVTDQEILARIRSFPRWHYEFDLEGHRTPIASPAWAVRHLQRKAYFFDPLVDLCGGSLVGKRVLDLGCNAGFWSLLAVQAGCAEVVGIDARQMHIEQANFVFEVKQVPAARYRFICGDVYQTLTADIGTFEVVLCLGLLYHLDKHLELLELISKLNSDLLVIDTALSLRGGPVLEIRLEDTDDPRRAWEKTMVMLPSRDALEVMLSYLGYRSVVLKPKFTDYTGSEGYRAGLRRALVAAKHSDLTRLSVPTESARPRMYRPVQVLRQALSGLVRRLE
ncbi:MAG TPA: class I SAM-dependent methyltransferase [bacterium]